MIPVPGTPAPDFTLLDQDGVAHTLSSHKGSPVLIYFYPKDDTPGCTKQACGIRDAMPALSKLDAIVFGISADSVKSHKKFAEKYGLPFTLLADEDHKVAEAYGVWGTKTMMGREYQGIRRTSFLIGKDGTIEKVYENVKPELHADQVLKDLAGHA
jgi:thioredoxin-dependent peroxiredoxin